MKRLLNKGKEHFKDKKKLAILGVVFLLLLVVVIAPSFAALTPVKSVEIESEKFSFDSNNPGAWKITKSAKWIEKGKARITIDIDTKLMSNNKATDVILVLDISSSMEGEKLSRVKEDTLYLINKLIPEGNRVALITFDTSSQIITDFTTDINLLTTSINNLTAIGTTNYYQALINVANVLKNYKYQKDRDCIALFLTDGYPCENTPNQIPQYSYLKTQYPYLTINGIQYEMGNTILQPVVEVSDNQYIASLETLNTFLLKSTIDPVSYSNLEITDYINTDYFIVENNNSIKADVGKISLKDNKVVWNLDTASSGNIYTLTIDIKLKDEFLEKGGIYPTNEKLEVTSKIENITEDISSTKTPILADNYQVIYEANAPEGCAVTNMPDNVKASVFDTVSITDNVPKCEGYGFKGWKIVTKGVTKVNDDYFIMPEDNVILRAIWGKNSISKSTVGTIYVAPTLYDIIADNSAPDNVASEFVSSPFGISFGSISSNTNGKGIYQAVKLEGENTPIYYYRGAVTNNNVIFADFCWKIVRTTSTKGVKLIYNGDPTNDQCLGTNPTIGNSPFNTSHSKANDVRYVYEDGTNSMIKGVVDTWYENNMTKYTSKLEDTAWCMDVSVSTIEDSIIYYGTYGRTDPSISCATEHQLKVSTTEKGLKLKYPVGLLTVDEIKYAGGISSNNNTSYYLYTGDRWWSLSPSYFDGDYAVGFYFFSNGALYRNNINNSFGIRPSVSLTPGTVVKEGNGSPEKPFIVE